MSLEMSDSTTRETVCVGPWSLEPQGRGESQPGLGAQSPPSAVPDLHSLNRTECCHLEEFSCQASELRYRENTAEHFGL